jgi:hypothetical protein
MNPMGKIAWYHILMGFHGLSMISNHLWDLMGITVNYVRYEENIMGI